MSSYIVYKHTCPSGKVYIGITNQKPEKRWANGTGYKHSPHFLAAVKKYGWENISHEILAEGLTREAAERMEIGLIERYKATDREYGYNTDRGGSTGPKHTEETRAKISEALRGERHPLYGSKQSPDWVEKRMAPQRGKRLSREHINKMAQARRVPVLCLDTGTQYESATEAGRRVGVSNSKITAVCRGRRKTAGGYRWEYVKEEAKL